ncbi:MAG: hypothetical protein GX575_32525 [Candidatus Anammoximicrobium sp.]|nr:hypothetical protein [Candidatus Anammoximicrobium sp.]
MTRLPLYLVLGAVTIGASHLHAEQTEDGNAPGVPVLVKLDAWADVDGIAYVRWVTAQGDPAKGQVEYGPTPDLGFIAVEDPNNLRGTTNNRDAGTGWANNHRADLRDIKAWPVSLRVTGTTRSGRDFASEVLTVNRPEQPLGRAIDERVRIAIDPGDWKVERLPITVGIPFAKGEWGDPARARVLIAGQEVACGVKAVVRWREDQSVKWARIDFLAPAAAREAVFQYGSKVARLKTGPDAAPTDATCLPIAAELFDDRGRRYCSVVQSSEIEESNPVKSVVKVSGHHVAEDGSKLFGFTARCHQWPAAGLQRVDYTVENDNIQNEFTSLQSLAIGLAGSQAAGRYTVGCAGDALELADGERVLQREDFQWIREPGSEKGKRLAGLVHLGGEDWAVMRNFWEQWPASVEVRDGRVLFGLCPRLPAGFYEKRPDEDKLYYQIRDGLHTLRQGFSKTWELWLYRGDAAAAPLLLGEKPVASVPPERVEGSRVLQGLGVAGRDQFPGYDEALAAGIERFLPSREAAREYGMMNFGDWHGERRWNWGNLEYDLGHGFLTQFVRSQNPSFFRRAEEAIRHERDVDTRHYASDPRRIGQQWTHCMGHTAGYYPADYKEMKVYATPGWSDNRGHVWSQGMFEHYLLGGDRRSFDTAKMISDVYGGPGTTNYSFFNAREPGWVGKMQMAAYLATEDLFYLNAAGILMDAVHEKSLATGDHGFHFHKLPTGHCNCPDDRKHDGEAGFMLAVEMTAQRMYYEETGDRRIADDIVKTARFIADTMWVPAQKGFRYTSCPLTSAAPGGWIQIQGMAFAARYANDERLADICRQALAAGWKNLPTSGKSAGYILCTSAQALDEVAQLPGPGFREYLERITAILNSPAVHRLPTLVPNPDFETGVDGWPSRGWKVEQCQEIKHSGSSSLKITGSLGGQGEYVNTTYDTASSPYEIKSLRPGHKYRLTARLRVDKISPGVPPPSLRIQFRDEVQGSRSAATTDAYDLSRLKTWQKLGVDFTVPDYNTRNYIALNTGTRNKVEVEMYLDDVSLVPADVAGEGPYSYLELFPEEAALKDGAQAEPLPDFPEWTTILGPGTASWPATVPAAGVYRLWLRAWSAGRAPQATIEGKQLPRRGDIVGPTWQLLGTATLPAGRHTISIQLGQGGATIGGLVLTDDPTELAFEK